MANAAKVQTALKLSEEDQLTIKSLKKEIEKAWKMVDSSYEKEARAKETISHLKLEISNLTRLVEQGAGMSMGEESTVNELLKQKEELIRELDQKVRRGCASVRHIVLRSAAQRSAACAFCTGHVHASTPK